MRYLAALAGFPDRALLVRTLDLALSADVRSQDAPFLDRRRSHEPQRGRPGLVVDRGPLGRARGRFPRNLLIRILEGLVALVDADLVARVHRFIASTDIPGRGRASASCEERMDINVAFADRVRPGLAAALATL